MSLVIRLEFVLWISLDALRLFSDDDLNSVDSKNNFKPDHLKFSQLLAFHAIKSTSIFNF